MTRLLATATVLTLAVLCAMLQQQQANRALAEQAIRHWIAFPLGATAAAVERYLEGANRWSDPDARFARGRWRAMPHQAGNPTLALADLHSAAALRPTWYRPWEAIAVLQARLTPNDGAWLRAADEAILRGPNESRLFATLFPVWRLHWHRLTSTQQQRVHQLMLSTAWREPALVFELADRYGYLPALCADAQDNRLVRLRCDNIVWSATDGADLTPD